MGLQMISTVVAKATAAFQGQQPYDLVDVATVRAELQIADGSRDSDLKRWIAQASRAAAHFADRVFPVELVLDQVFPDRDPYPQVALGTVSPLQLSRWPVAASPCVARIAAPPAPVLSTAAGGVLAAARCYVRVTYVTAAGETAVSAESNIAVPANGLLQVASPAADPAGLATGWNVYAATVAGKESLQNATPIAIGTAWLEPVGGLIVPPVSLAPLPSFVAAIENGIPLTEGVDFLTDFATGELTRLDVNGWPKRWPKLPIAVLYPAGYVFTDPDFADAQEAAIRMVKARWFAQPRDPALREENVVGVYQAQYWSASGPGAAVGDLTPDIEAMLERYRVPSIG